MIPIKSPRRFQNGIFQTEKFQNLEEVYGTTYFLRKIIFTFLTYRPEAKMAHDEHCDCGCEHEDYEPILINTVTDTGEELTFELLEIFDFEGKDYARLQPYDEDADDDEDLLMECESIGDEYIFHAIENDALFERIVAYLNAQIEDEDGECDCEECCEK